MYLRIFSLTTSQSQKFILKADLKRECPYFFFYVEGFDQYLKKSKNGCPIVFSKSDLTNVGYFYDEILGGSMPEAQI